MRKVKILLVFAILIMGVYSSCKRTSKYHALVERELATNVRNDTLLMDLRFGMNKREFFAHCWELHKKGIFSEGATNTTVHYQFERFGKEYSVDFYPNFHEGKIVELPVEYKYTAFAPWNSKFSIDSLLTEVVNIQKEEYGVDFLEIRPKDKNKGTAYVRVDGNRRISIHKNIVTNAVEVRYFDLLSKKQEASPDGL